MKKKYKCPMMYEMQMMHQPGPMCLEPGMVMAGEAEMDNYFKDEEDDRRFMKMYPEICRRMMVYVRVEIDRMEEKDAMIHGRRPDREMINRMTESAYTRMIKEMPEMAEGEETRQYTGRRYSRDMLRLLLLNELFRRRRRFRRRHFYGYPYGWDSDNDFNDFDDDYNDFDNDFYDYD